MKYINTFTTEAEFNNVSNGLSRPQLSLAGSTTFCFSKGSTPPPVPPTPTQPNNEIWYTSTDGKIVTPNKQDVFGVPISTNTYEDGKGVITFAGDVETVGGWAFSGTCQTLQTISLPDSVKSIGQCAFSYCIELTSFTINNSIKIMGIEIFDNCTKLAACTIGTGMTSIPAKTFYECSSLTNCTIGANVTEIGRYAFGGCTSLAGIEIPDGVTTIGESAFDDCRSLQTINIPNSVTTIVQYAFHNCIAAEDCMLGNSVSTIGEYTFQNCRVLTRIISLNPEPPALANNNVFDGVKTDCPIYVTDKTIQTKYKDINWAGRGDYIFVRE